jgi:hypothetical protein
MLVWEQSLSPAQSGAEVAILTRCGPADAPPHVAKDAPVLLLSGSNPSKSSNLGLYFALVYHP